MDIDWVISVDSLISTCFSRWFDLFNYNPSEQKHRGMIWLIRTQFLQILWDSVHILTHTLNNFCHPHGRQLYCKRHPLITNTENQANSSNLLCIIKCVFLQPAEENWFMIFMLVQNVPERKDTCLRNIPEI